MLNIADEAKYDTKILNHLDLIRMKANGEKDCRVAVLEFHPNDSCNLRCSYCTYDDKVQFPRFPFSKLEVLNKLQPKAIVISGGGEPTIYNSEGHNFNDLVHSLKQIVPQAKLGLTTNGQGRLSGDWPELMDWIRVSVDSASPTTFRNLKGGELSHCIDAIVHYLNAGVPSVGAGYVFNQHNITEVSDFVNLMVTEVLRFCGPSACNRLNLQFRPTCMIQSCHCPSPRYRDRNVIMVPDMSLWWEKTIESVRNDVYANTHSGFREFLDKNTNLNENSLFKYNNQPADFDRCYISLARVIVRADGYMFPCVVKATNMATPIGNILNDSLDEIHRSQMNYFACQAGYCNGYSECCRITARKNAIVMSALNTPFFDVPDDNRSSDFF